MRILSDGERSVVNDSYQARVIQLEHVAPQDAVTFLQPLVSKDGQISAFGAANMILVVDSAFNIQKVLGILKHIDTDQVREGAELVFLKNFYYHARGSLTEAQSHIEYSRRVGYLTDNDADSVDHALSKLYLELNKIIATLKDMAPSRS
jgi:type II secretory pathway component GspD/PulD (secretin)